MRLSRCYMPTLKEAPGDAEVISHKLLVRAGMIRKLTSGIYNYLPLGLKAVNKAANIVRREMNAAGAQEILMPMVQPGDLWTETGRWEFYGKELLRVKDRHERDYCLGPTHEEVVTDLVRGEIKSYRQLPVNLYQIQNKFRDEVRPRFGLMRGREFLMKDAYSFDKDDAGADVSYQAMYQAYRAIFSAMGLAFVAVEADSGSIGGSFSHEFMVTADTGEDTIAVCGACEYAANLEKAEVVCNKPQFDGEVPPFEEVATPGTHTVEEVAGFLKIPAEQVVKTLLFDADGEPVAALVRGDRELNDVKLKNILVADKLNMAMPEQVKEWTGAPVGFAGPVGLDTVKKIYADTELSCGADYVVGANKADAHLKHVHLQRDAKIAGFTDLRVVTPEDPCPRCVGDLTLTKGIEVGHVFKLGRKYSMSMDAAFLDENGKEQYMVMGCYGIGVSRVVAACIEQNHDEWGIIFPPPLAPFEAVVVCLDSKDDEVAGKAEEIYNGLLAMGLDAALDDRDERPGVKFKDIDLIGAPMQIVVGGKGLKKGSLEVKNRKTGDKGELPANGFLEAFPAWKDEVYKGWGLE